MEGHRHPVGGGVDVGLHMGEAQIDRVAERSQRVLRELLGPAAVGEGDGPVDVQVGMGRHTGTVLAATPAG